MISESGVSRSQKGARVRFSPHDNAVSAPCCLRCLARYLNTSANVLTVSTACAAGLDAIGLAAQDIVSGTYRLCCGGRR